MMIATTPRLTLVLAMTACFAIACSKPATKGSIDTPKPEPEAIREVTAEKNSEIESRLFLTLVDSKNSESKVASGEQVRSTLKDHCQSCHSAESATRMDLSVLPSAEQSPEILKRVELEVSAPGHMPIGSALPSDAKKRLVGWLADQNKSDGEDPFTSATVKIQKSDAGILSAELAVERQGPGRFSIALGKLPIGSAVSFALKISFSGKTTAMNIDVPAVPEDGNITQTLSLDLAKLTTDTDSTVTDIGGGDGTDVETSPVDAILDIHLVSAESTAIPDEKALEILRVSCKSCHNSQNDPRWDLTVVPKPQNLSEIAHRINLDARMLGHMPVGGVLPADDLTTLNRWITEQKNPSQSLVGYSVQAVEIQTGSALVPGELDNNRIQIALGRHLPGASVSVRVTVTGADGVSADYDVSLVVSEGGIFNTDITVAARDTTAPTIPTKTIAISNLTASSAKFKFSPAQDDRPAEHLTYLAYRSVLSHTEGIFDSVDHIETTGIRVGPELNASQGLSFDVSGLEAESTYFFNVVVIDRTGNKSIYQKLEVQTLPLVLCDAIATAGSIGTWRDDLARRLDERTINGKKATEEIRNCFKAEVPQCVNRTLNIAEKDDVAPSGSDGTLATVPQKRPPDEIKDLVGGEGKYWIPDNIEEIAKQKGWTSVRYKSRHAGGFDSDTPNLLMVFVPGDKVDPPVSFDRWLNFPLPIDDDEPELGLPQNPRPKFGPPKREEYVPGNDFPRTFTMVSQERATATAPGTVYFQMFRRGQTATFSPGGAVGMGGCVSCHPNGLRAIAPLGYDLRQDEARLSDEDWKAVELIDRKMVEGAGFKAANWGDGIVNGVKKPLYRADIGPIMGPAVPANGISRTKEFIMGGTLNGEVLRGCFNRRNTITIEDIFGRAPGMYEPHFKFKLSDTPNINPDKIIAAMSCEGCHTKGQRWPINEDTDLDQVRFKILVDQSMPLGAHMNPLDSGNDTNEVVDRLTPDERFALTNCLEAEFELEQRKKLEWMTQVQCQQ